MAARIRLFQDLAGQALHTGDSVSLSRENSRHLFSVLRAENDSYLVLCCSSSHRSFVCLANPATQAVVIKEELGSSPVCVSRTRTLVFGLSKGDKNDFVCEKATELGVSQIIFWQTTTSIVRLDAGDRIKKLSRWQKIAEAASKQSGRSTVPAISLVFDVEELVTTLKSTSDPQQASPIRLFCSLRPHALELLNLPLPQGPVDLVVGPEGDFTDKEETGLLNTGFTPLRLGNLILRSETAAVVAIAMVQGAWGSCKL